MQIIGELPLSALHDLIKYAQKKESENQIYPLWLAHFVLSKLGGYETIPYGDLISGIKSEDTATKITNEQIFADLMPIINKGGGKT